MLFQGESCCSRSCFPMSFLQLAGFLHLGLSGKNQSLAGSRPFGGFSRKRWRDPASDDGAIAMNGVNRQLCQRGVLRNCAIKVRGSSGCSHLQPQGEVCFTTLISCGIFWLPRLLVFHVCVCPQVLGTFWGVQRMAWGFCAPSGLNVSYVAVVCSCESLEADLCFVW